MWIVDKVVIYPKYKIYSGLSKTIDREGKPQIFVDGTYLDTAGAIIKLPTHLFKNFQFL